MKIAIDISPVVYGTGVSVYTKKLVENLLNVSPEIDYVFYGGSLRRTGDIRVFLKSLVKGKFSEKVLPIPPVLADLIWNRLHIMPIEMITGKIDIYHSSDWTQAPSKAFKVTTVHDLVPILHPEWSHPKIVETQIRRLELVRREVDLIIAPTKNTEADLVSLGFPKEKIRVVPEGVDPDFGKVDLQEARKSLGKYGINGGYLLAVGVNERKNTRRIIEAFLLRKHDHDLKLVIIGYPYKEFQAQQGIIFTNHIPDTELRFFYKASQALVYPSLYEGFGLPIIEAFKAGVPVVTSRGGSTEEIAGGAAVLVDPEDTVDISRGITEALKNREKLVKTGSKVAEKYTWDSCARKTLEIYKEFEV